MKKLEKNGNRTAPKGEEKEKPKARFPSTRVILESLEVAREKGSSEEIAKWLEVAKAKKAALTLKHARVKEGLENIPREIEIDLPVAVLNEMRMPERLLSGDIETLKGIIKGYYWKEMIL